MSATVIAAEHDERGRLFAAFDPEAHHVEPGVPTSRFAAFLAAFRTSEEAERALLEAGALVVGRS
jgi:hypothetical protein